MSINWYPGHMFKARKEIDKTAQKVDLLIEIVDARLPFSSQNPAFNTIRHQKPSILVFNKSDLADPITTEKWQQYYKEHQLINTLVCTQQQPQKTKTIFELCKKLAPEKSSSFKPVEAMIVGIPNVGKSTIINTLTGKVIAKTGNEPAVTKAQQKIYASEGLTLFDTPGILWPKIANPHGGYRLAISGAIKNTAVEFEDLGFYLAEFMLAHYAERLQQRYQITDLPTTPLELLEAIGHKRGAKQAGGRVNLHKACEILLHDYRSGQLGLLSLETPSMINRELEELELVNKNSAKTSKKQKS